MQITIHNPSNLPLIDYRSLKPLQGNLKELKPKNYQKLKNVLMKRGFRVPYFVWREVKGGEINNWLMDGHGRQKVMIEEDMQPYPVPYVLIEAADLREAKAQLLEITSQYQTVTRKGFEEFTGELDATDFEDVVFDAFEVEQIKRNPPSSLASKSIIITFTDPTELEGCLAEIQEVCEGYISAQIKVNE